MEKSKENILLYSSHYDAIMELDDSEAGKLLKAIISYAKHTDYEINKKSVEYGVFMAIKTQIDYEKKKYLATCEQNRRNSKQGWNKRRQIYTDNATAYDRIHNDNDSDSDSDIDSENGSDSVSSIISSSTISSFSKENKEMCDIQEQQNNDNSILSYGDFDFSMNTNQIDLNPKAEYQVREFSEKETNLFLKEIRKIFNNDFSDNNPYSHIYMRILDYITGELEEQKAKGKYNDKDDSETLLRFIRQKKKPEQKERFISDFLNKYPEYNTEIEQLTEEIF